MSSGSLVHEQAVAEDKVLTEQLQAALNSRVVIEQSKGLLAQRGELDMPQAFAVLRQYSRDHNRRLGEVAAALVSRELPAERVLDHMAQKHGRERLGEGGSR